MSYQDPPRRQRLSRYPALAQHEDTYQETQADFPSGYSTGNDYQGLAGLAHNPGQQSSRQPAPWDDAAQQTSWDTPAQQSWSMRQPDMQQPGWDPNHQASTGPLLSGDAPAGAGAGRRSRGILAGATTGFLAAGVAIGVANLVAAFVRPQASPIIAVGEAFIDRTPQGLKEFAIQKFGENDKNMLLLGMYVTIALLAMTIGIFAWRRVSIGVAGIALFGLFGGYVAITRPDSHVTDVIPSVVGGIIGIAALLLLVRVGGARRRGRVDWAGGAA
jgi:hypothetical protein